MRKLGIYFLICALYVFKMQAQENSITTRIFFRFIKYYALPVEDKKDASNTFKLSS